MRRHHTKDSREDARALRLHPVEIVRIVATEIGLAVSVLELSADDEAAISADLRADLDIVWSYNPKAPTDVSTERPAA